MKFARFMATPVGRAIRILAGLALIAIGILLLWPWGLILSVVGAVVAFAGIERGRDATTHSRSHAGGSFINEWSDSCHLLLFGRAEDGGVRERE